MITINEKTMAWEKGMTIADILKNLAFDYPQKIVSVDEQPIPPDDYHTFIVEDHAKIKVVFVCHGG
jgi:thiamine biosynthesis protein ThiS